MVHFEQVFAPTTFGKYYLYEKLAAGGMAEIYKAKLLGPGGFEKHLVIKQIKPELARRREFVELFVDEAKVTVQLSHGNIVPVYELGMVDGTYFIAMEYVDGPALTDVLRAARKQKRTLPPPLAAHVAVEILKGLDYAHRQRVLHRDLSPGNVLVSRAGEVKIVDFGLATSAARLTGQKLVGSYAYMSPEQADSQELDARSDLFSCGILLWEMLTARSLFTDEDDERTLARVRSAEVAPPSQLAPSVPPELDAIVLRALGKSPEKRFARAAEFQAALVRWLYSGGTLPAQDDVGRFVSEVCPPAPAPVAKPSDATPVMGVEAIQSAVKEVSFATNVTFEREVLTRAGIHTPHAGVEAATRAMGRPRRRPLVWAGVAIAVALIGSATALIARKPAAAPELPAPPVVRHEPVVAETPVPPEPKPEPAPPVKHVARATPRVTAPKPQPAAAASLTLNATPWADFYLDGHKLDGCPIVGRATTAGDHAVRVVCPDHQERTQPVTLGAGTTTKRVFDCNQPGIPVVGP